MKSVVGIFGTRQAAERAASMLDSAGIARSRIAVLTPQSTEQEIAAVPTMDAEQPGMGMALGATVGGAMGLAGGVTLGALASVLIPGVGPILAIGFAGSALGLLGGGALGGNLDSSLSDGIPQDELYIYEDALRQGRSVVIAFAENHAQVESAHHSLKASGAESVDRAGEMWWIGLRDIEKEHYDAGGRNSGKAKRSSALVLRLLSTRQIALGPTKRAAISSANGTPSRAIAMLSARDLSAVASTSNRSAKIAQVKISPRAANHGTLQPPVTNRKISCVIRRFASVRRHIIS
jgi:hypothetical protein